jgi:Domain of unknown function (DUF397)
VREKSVLRKAEYHISSFSGGGNCVAVAKLDSGEYVVRHSRDAAQQIVLTEEEWRAFRDGVLDGQFDF